MKTTLNLALCLAAAAFIAGSSSAIAAPACKASGKLQFICGTMNSEDLVRVPGTKWIVASGFAGGGAKVGHLYLVDSDTGTWKPLFPGDQPQMQLDKAVYQACPGPPDLAKFSTHGLNLRPGEGGKDTLFAVNHGGREAIEIFTLDASGAEPKASWIGCAVMPPHTWPNSVAPLPGGGMVVTDMFDPQDPKAPEKMNAGKVTGAVYEWHPETGYKLVPGSRFSGDNGIEVSPDGKWIYLAAWGNKAVVRLSRGAKPFTRDVLKVGFLADNLRWASDGNLMIAGQAVPAKRVFACFQSAKVRCTQPWRIVEWNTGTMTLRPVIRARRNRDFGDATVGLEVGDRMFVGTFRGDRIAYFSLK